MGSFLDAFKGFGGELGNGVANGLSGGLSGIVGGAMGALTSSLFGPSLKDQIKWQKEAQKELNEQAADLNYQYGERAAQNAYNRQMAMYERSYEDQSYAAMRKQMEKANLSVGLMYGGSGSGGGAGSMTGAPQGATGGATAGDAAAGMQLALEAKRIAMESAATMAEINLKNAQAKNLESSTQNLQEKTTTEREMREFNKELAKQEGMGQWIQNVRDKWADMQKLFYEDGEPEDYVTEHKLYGTYAILAESLANQKAIAEANKSVFEGQRIVADTQVSLEKAREISQQITQLILNGEADRALTKAKELEATANQFKIKLETGEEINWKSGLYIAFDAINMLCNVGKTVGDFVSIRNVAKFLRGRLQKNGQLNKEIDDILNDWTQRGL